MWFYMHLCIVWHTGLRPCIIWVLADVSVYLVNTLLTHLIIQSLFHLNHTIGNFPPLFHISVSQGPHVLVPHNVANSRFLLAYFNKSAGDGLLRLADTLQKQQTCSLKVDLLLKSWMPFLRSSSARGLLLYTLCFNRTGWDLANERVTVLCPLFC